jgi:hypothetical protein
MIKVAIEIERRARWLVDQSISKDDTNTEWVVEELIRSFGEITGPDAWFYIHCAREVLYDLVADIYDGKPVGWWLEL